MAPAHTDKLFDEQLDRLTSSIGAMGEFAISQVDDAVRALIARDVTLANRIVEQDHMIDSLRRDLSASVALVIAQRQPLASDLDEILADLRIVEDLERVGDLAKNIARRTNSLSESAFPEELTLSINDLSRQCNAQLRNAVGAFLHRDAGRARDVKLLDDPIDQKHHDIVDRVIELMKIERLEIGDYVHLLFCVKNVERIADHAVNIAEAAHLKSTGRPIGPVTSLNAG
jgi:phosphate transport system protein